MGPDREAEAAAQLQRRQAFWASLVAGCTALQAMRAAVLQQRKTVLVSPGSHQKCCLGGSYMTAMQISLGLSPAPWRQHAAVQQAVCMLGGRAIAALLIPGLAL